ncbi:hypothetical protein [Brevibacillus agri]|uniref:hypothetical protein n=1 Tax=Brevibacillus agri TaxID=51101 RepID=UPI0025B72014|nr:hypothetical protein [Brevibacillus agri]MDN4096227.1 hypothetical protein [Brevibacillus agri]MED3501920.1 hypothetical protein [Brevibacillus agri]
MNKVKTNEPLSQDKIGEKKDIVMATIEEVKKQELISVLAGLIKNYALKKDK